MTVGDWVSIVGLAIVIWQIWRTGRIARATQRAVEDATRRVGIYNVLLIVPELSRLEREIEDAVKDNETSALRRLFKEWREMGTDLRGALSNENVGNLEMDRLITESVGLAMVAKQTILNGRVTDIVQATKKVRISIEQVCVEARMLAARIKSSATPLGILELPVEKQQIIPRRENAKTVEKEKGADRG